MASMNQIDPNDEQIIVLTVDELIDGAQLPDVALTFPSCATMITLLEGLPTVISR